jgi:hypothetical protein
MQTQRDKARLAREGSQGRSSLDVVFNGMDACHTLEKKEVFSSCAQRAF